MQRLFLGLCLGAAALSPSCIFAIEHDLRVDGVELEERHQESLELGGWDGRGLVIDSPYDDVTIEATSGPSRVVGFVLEERLGDARMVYEDGALRARSDSGSSAALGELHIYIHGPLPSLTLSGTGDFRVRGIVVEGDVLLETGYGDVSVEDVRVGGDVRVSTGLGDLALCHLEADTLNASTGLGDLDVNDVEASRADLATGLGDIALRRSELHFVDAETGLGDIEVESTTYEHGNLNTGLGSVRR